MSLRIYLSTILFVTISTLALFLYLLFLVDPIHADPYIIILFIGSLSLSLLGVFTLSRYYITKHLTGNELYYANFITSLREGTLFGAFITSILTLSLYDLISFFDGILIFLSFILFELYFLAKK
jgi:hypothetical protein